MLCYVLAQFVDLLGKELGCTPRFLNQVTSSNSLDRQMRQSQKRVSPLPCEWGNSIKPQQAPFLSTSSAEQWRFAEATAKVIGWLGKPPKATLSQRNKRIKPPENSNEATHELWYVLRAERFKNWAIMVICWVYSQRIAKGAKNDSKAFKSLKFH